MTVKEFVQISNDRRIDEINDCLNYIKAEIQDSKMVSDMVVILKKDGVFVTRGTTLRNAPELIAKLELLKFDIIERMRVEENGE